MRKPIVFCAAIPQEVRPLCKRLGIDIPTPKKRTVAGVTPEGCVIRIAVSGMGYARMSALMDEIPNGPVSCWVSIGFAGALMPQLSTGDCIIGHTVVTDEDEIVSCHDDSQVESSKLDRLYCSTKAICTPDEKKALSNQTSAVAVDMESAAVARFAQKRGEPFTWIRVISDAAHESIPPDVMHCLSPEGFPSPTAAFKRLIHSPRLLPSFIQLGIRSGKCAERMAEAILPWILLYHSPSIE